MSRRTAIMIVASIVVAAGAIAGAPPAAVAAPPLARVTVMPMGHLAAGGSDVAVRLLFRCAPGNPNGIQWEGYVYATQGSRFAWAEMPLVCDGRPHLAKVDLSVTEPFNAGRAQVSASIVDENTLSTYASDTRLVRLVTLPCQGDHARHGDVAAARAAR